MSLIDFANKNFGELKKTNPKKANSISHTTSGDPFGLYPDTDAYRASKSLVVEFDEDGNLITDIETL